MRRRLSLLINSEPAVAPEQPGHSILLNGNETSNIGSSSSSSRSPPVSPQSPTARTRPRSTSRSTYHAASPSPARPSCSSKVSFAPLPVVPPELKRRNTITLGVAARKNLLTGQGTVEPVPGGNSAAARPSGSGSGSNGGMKSLYLTDEEWEQYKDQYAAKQGETDISNDPVDVGEVVKTGAKSLWRKVRSPRTASTGSNSSDRASPSPASERRGSAPELPPMRVDIPTQATGLDMVLEEPNGARSPGSASSTSPRRTSEPNFGDWGAKPSPTSTRSITPGSSSTLQSRGRTSRSSSLTSPSMLSPPLVQDLSLDSATDKHLNHHARRPSPPPRLQDRLPDEDELDEGAEEGEDPTPTDGLDETSIKGVPYDPADRIPWKPPIERTESREGSGRDSAILGFDRVRAGFSM